MSVTKMLLQELQQEAATTRKFLSIIPEDKYNWQPHPKSMTIQQLVSHIAELPGWTKMVLETSELDFAAAPYTPSPVSNNADVLALFEKSNDEATTALANASDEDLLPNWILRNGEQIYSSTPKGEMIRTCFSQTVHHRAQLGVFLRLLDVSIPGSYGPSADESF